MTERSGRPPFTPTVGFGLRNVSVVLVPGRPCSSCCCCGAYGQRLRTPNRRLGPKQASSQRQVPRVAGDSSRDVSSCYFFILS